jgi:hypothetical protein
MRPVRTLFVRARSEPQTALLVAFLVGLHSAGVAWARPKPCDAVKKLDSIKPIGDARRFMLRCDNDPSLKGYCEIEIASYLFDANRGVSPNRKDRFIRVVESALEDYLDLESYRDYDVRFESDLTMSGKSDLTGSGKNPVIVAAVDGHLHFSIFDGEGHKIKDIDENDATGQVPRINELREQLQGWRGRQPLTRSDKDRVIGAVTSVFGPKRSRYNVTRVIAPAGYGKSALLRYLDDILKPKSEIRKTREVGRGANPLCVIRDKIRDNKHLKDKQLIYTIKLDELGGKFAIRTTMLDDLKNDAGFPLPAFGKLRAFDYDEHAAPGVEFLLKAFIPGFSELDRPILIIDSIDEIHPESAKSLLNRFDEYIEQREKDDREAGTLSVLQIFVVGRPEGFSDYYRIPQGGRMKELPIELRPPSYQTTGDLRKAVESVAQFALFGERKVDPTILQSAADKSIDFMNNHSFLRESPFNLSEFGELIKVSDKYSLDLGEPYVQDLFFGFLLGRTWASHNRPTAQYEDYTRLLEEIAAKYACNVDGEGYFFVTPGDTVHIDVEVDGKRRTRKSSYLVEAVLNRSGVAYLNPVNLYVPRYGFYPSWVHKYLFCRYQKRQKAPAK